MESSSFHKYKFNEPHNLKQINWEFKNKIFDLEKAVYASSEEKEKIGNQLNEILTTFNNKFDEETINKIVDLSKNRENLELQIKEKNVIVDKISQTNDLLFKKNQELLSKNVAQKLENKRLFEQIKELSDEFTENNLQDFEKKVQDLKSENIMLKNTLFKLHLNQNLQNSSNTQKGLLSPEFIFDNQSPSFKSINQKRMRQYQFDFGLNERILIVEKKETNTKKSKKIENLSIGKLKSNSFLLNFEYKNNCNVSYFSPLKSPREYDYSNNINSSFQKSKYFVFPSISSLRSSLLNPFKKTCMLERGTLYEENGLQLGAIMKKFIFNEKILCLMEIYFVNKRIEKKRIDFYFTGDGNVGLWISKGIKNEINELYSDKKEISFSLEFQETKMFEIKLDAENIPFDLIKLVGLIDDKIDFSILLPISYNNFLFEEKMNECEFLKRWKKLKNEETNCSDQQKENVYFYFNQGFFKDLSILTTYFENLIALNPEDKYDYLINRGYLKYGLFYSDGKNEEYLIKIKIHSSDKSVLCSVGKGNDWNKKKQFLLGNLLFFFERGKI